MTISLKLTSLAIIAVFFFSCGGGKEAENTENTAATNVLAKDTTAVTVEDTTKFKFDFTIANIPSPANSLQELKTWELAYDNTILNDPKKVEKYNTEYKQSINLGIYNIDMAHAMINDNGSDVLNYMKTVLTLGNKLGLMASLNAMVGQRAENNLNNKDSLFELLDEIFVKSDTYLRTNERVYTAATIFAGSWIEGLYLTCAISSNLTDEVKKSKSRELLWNQRLYLGNLLNLMGDFKDKKECADLIKELKPIYEEIVSAKQPSEMSDEKFKSISTKLITLRNKLVA
jgi:hypothetical protein